MLLGQKRSATSAPSSSSHSWNNPLNVEVEGRSRAQVAVAVAKAIAARDGLRGFYRGYVVSLCTYVPSSASWWTFYHLFQVGTENSLGVCSLNGRCNFPRVRRRWKRVYKTKDFVSTF
jgi:hypothetical protein